MQDQKEIEFNFHSVRPEEGPLKGVVVDAKSRAPIANAEICGIYRHQLAGRDLEIKADSHGEFHITRELHRMVLVAQGGAQRGILEIGPDDQQITIPVMPVAVATGKLIDQQTKLPLEGKEIQYGVKVHIGDDDAPWRTAFGGRAITDREGKFTLQNLVQGVEYSLDVVREDKHSYASIGEVKPAATSVDLGELKLSPPPVPYKPPTVAERVESAFQVKSIASRLKDGKRDATLGHLQLLVILADPKAPATEQLLSFATKMTASEKP